MNDGYFDNTLNFHAQILRRKLVVQEQLNQLDNRKYEEFPDVSCCLLKTELEYLTKCSDTIDRELWHMREKPNTLAKTSKGMVSSDWKGRLRAEWAQLCIRMDRLDSFRDAFRKDEHGFAAKWDERLLCDQLRAMRTYRDCLLQYAKLEGVDLDMSLYDDSYIYDYYFNKEET